MRTLDQYKQYKPIQIAVTIKRLAGWVLWHINISTLVGYLIPNTIYIYIYIYIYI